MEWLRSVLWYTEEERRVLSEEGDSPLLQRHSMMLPIGNGVRVVAVPAPQVQENIPTVLLLHGLGGQASQFEHLIDYLAYFCGVVAIDFPGHGKSPPPKSYASLGSDQLVDLCCEILDLTVATSTKVVVIGHSLGAHTALRLSTRLGSQRCPGVIALTPPAYEQPPVSPIVQTMLRWLPPVIFDVAFRASDRRGGVESLSVRRMIWSGTEDTKVLMRQWRVNLQSRSDTVLQTLGRAQYFDAAEALLVPCPVLVVAAEHDVVCPKDQAELLRGWLAQRLAKYEPFAELADSPDTQNSSATDGCSKEAPGRGSTAVNPDHGISDSDTSDDEDIADAVRPAVNSPEVISNDNVTGFAATNGDRMNKTTNNVLHNSTQTLPVVVVRNAGHALMLEQPELVQAVVADFLMKYVDSRMSLAHHLAVRDVAFDKWSLKNERKWAATLPVGGLVGGLRGLKTLRQDDEEHGPLGLETRCPGISHVIDISRDQPPYDPKSFRRIRYHKFPTVSKIPPSPEETRGFVQLANELVKDGEVGVHCHYGFNRTGFLICSYLIESRGYTVRSAVEAFAESRPPGIRHQHFVDELFVRYS